MFSLFKNAFTQWKQDNIAVWSAALSYYTVFSLSPLLLIALSIAGLFFGHQAVQGQVYDQLKGLLGTQSAAFIQNMLAHAQKPSTNIITTIVGVITLILGASGVFGQLKQALNHIWEVETKPRVGIMGLIRDRFLTFSMVGVIGFLLLVSLIASAVISGIATFFSHFLPMSGVIVEVINFVISLLLLTCAFGLVFKVLPDVQLPWRRIWPGAIVTAILFTIGKELIGLYLGHSSVSSTYGAAGSLVIILLWSYYAGQILFFGAEFTKASVKRAGYHVQPSKYAVSTIKEVPRTQKEKADDTLLTLVGYILSGFFFQLFQKQSKRHK